RSLVAQIRTATSLDRGELPLSVTPADMNCLHDHLRQVVPSYAGSPAPGSLLIFENAVDHLADHRRAPVIVVTSAKGGAGKTTTTLMLAFSAAYLAARSGNRMNVAVVELDLPGAVARSLVSTKRPAAEQRTIIDYVNAAEATEAALAEAMETVVAVDGAGSRLMPEGSVRILLGPRRTMDAPNVDPRHVGEIVDLLSRDPDIDLVLIDTSADVIDSPILAAAFAVSDQLLYVIEDKPTSYAKMGETLLWLQKSMDVPAERMKVIVNKSVRTVADQTLRDDLVDHSSGVAALGVIPQSPFLHAFDGADTGSMWAAFFLDDERPLADAFRSLVVALLPKPSTGLDGGPVLPAAPLPAKRRRLRR
ncbi:MAG: ParA family protein, partial [bacterium]|nr:ParA family protein [bacterium]